MTNYLKLKIPTIRHSDFKAISQYLSIKKTNSYFLNTSPSFKKNCEEFRKFQYSKINQDKTLFKHKNKNLYKKRSEILRDEIKKRFKKNIKILDYGCNKGELLHELKKSGYTKLFGHDVNINFSKNLRNKKINYLKFDEISLHKFDLVIFSHSISYVKNLTNLLKTIKSILNKNSYIIINCPDVSKRQFTLCFGDQKFFFEKRMIQNLFQKFGKVKFLDSDYLINEIISLVSIKDKIKKKRFIKKVNDKNLKILHSKIKKINLIKKTEKNIDIFHYNFQSKIIFYILDNKNCRFVYTNKRNDNKNNLIEMKHYLKSLNPIIISKNNENKKTISLLKKNKKKIYTI